MRKFLMAASAAGMLFALGIASPAGAVTTFNVTDIQANPGLSKVVNLSDPGLSLDENVYLTAFVFTGTENGNPKIVSLKVFCDDIDNYLSVGPGQNMNYTFGSVSPNADGTVLTPTQIGVMGALAKDGAASTDPMTIMEDQGAIWDEEYGSALTIGSSDNNLLAGIANQLNWAQSHPLALNDVLGLISSDHFQNQMMGVPEPATWATMLLGFGAIGASMRSRRKQRVAAA